MLNAFLLIFAPVRTWERIADSRRGIFYVLVTYLIPIMVLTSFCEGYGLMHWGKWQGEPLHIRKLSQGEAIVFEAGQFLATLLIIVINAALAKSVGSTFHGRHTFSQGFTATGIFSYGVPQNITKLVSWSSSNTAVAPINKVGVATSAAVGTTTITATMGTVSSSTSLTVQ